MSAPIRELMHFASPVTFTIMGEGTGEPQDRLVIRGFASVETNDRSGDYTSPTEFNIDEFLAAPTLLLNHRFWTDYAGNQVAIGRVLTMHAAKLVTNPDNPDSWNVQDLKSKEVINNYPKAKVPSLSKGTRGLFVTAEVTQPEVIAQVARGELSGMSWRGLVVVDYEINPETHLTMRVLKDIDLYEVSITHVPDHNQSTFIIGKNVDGKLVEVEGASLKDVQLWKVQLLKSRFASVGMATEYLKAHGLSPEISHEDETSYYSVQCPSDHLDLDKTVRIKMADALMLMAPPIETPKGVSPESRLVAELVDVAKSLSPTELASMSDTTLAAAPATTAEEGTTVTTPGDDAAKIEAEKAAKAKMDEEAKKKAELDKGKEGKTKSAAELQLETLGSHVGSAVASMLKPSLEGIAASMTTMAETQRAIVEKMAAGAAAPASGATTKTETETEGKTDLSKAADLQGVMNVLGDLAAKLDTQMAETQQKLVDVAKSALALGESIPNGGLERSEGTVPRTDVTKSAISGKSLEEDKNGCLDGAFPFLS